MEERHPEVVERPLLGEGLEEPLGDARREEDVPIAPEGEARLSQRGGFHGLAERLEVAGDELDASSLQRDRGVTQHFRPRSSPNRSTILQTRTKHVRTIP